MKTELVQLRIDTVTKEQATKKAESLGLSLSGYIRMLIKLDTKEDCK